MREGESGRKGLQSIFRHCEVALAIVDALLCPFCFFLGLGVILLRMRPTGGNACSGAGVLFVFDTALLWYTANIFWRGVESAVKNERRMGRYAAGAANIVVALVHAVLFLKGGMPYASLVAVSAANALLLLRPAGK